MYVGSLRHSESDGWTKTGGSILKKRGFGVKNHFLGSFWAIVTTQTIFMPIRLHGRPSHLTSHHIQVKSCFLVSSSNRFWPFLPIFGSFWHWLSPRHNLNPHHLLFPSFHIIPQVFPNKRSNPRHFIFFQQYDSFNCKEHLALWIVCGIREHFSGAFQRL